MDQPPERAPRRPASGRNWSRLCLCCGRRGGPAGASACSSPWPSSSRSSSRSSAAAHEPQIRIQLADTPQGPPTIQQPKEPANLDGLEAVRCHFYTLINFNKLQSFLAASLIYTTVILVGSLIAWLTPPAEGAARAAPTVITETPAQPYQWPSSHAHAHAQQWRPSPASLSHGTHELGSNSTAVGRSVRWTAQLHFYLAAPLECLLIYALLALTGDFGRRQHTEPEAGLAPSGVSPRQRLALALCLLSLLLVPTLGLIMALGQPSFDNGSPEMVDLGPWLVLIYLTPALLVGESRRSWSLAVALVETLALLLASGRLYLDYRAASQAEQWARTRLLVSLSLVLAALLFGLRLSSALGRQLARRTFKGATELVEAKVSLEHQRQQQETLLLSVLPAYVAEQVKRNMLKKTTSSGSGNTPIQGAANELASPAATTVQWQASSQQKSRSFTTLHQPSSPALHHAETDHQHPVGLGNRTESAHIAPQRNHSFLGAHLSRPATGGPMGDHLATELAARPMLSLDPTSGAPNARRGFNELYIRTYNNVSLLYGDIVGFTRLCGQLSSWQLVRILNDLFSHFDQLAETHRIMRIKILGDCYYGVSGIPEFAVMGAKSRASRNENHAVNCVNMGLDMIHYIRRLNVERATSTGQQGVAETCASPLPAFELNMRIGIHSGHVHSGVIGLKKWQFDVWSNDVSIAMHCESSGVAGRVQVTQATVQQLNGAFSYEPGPGPTRDALLASNDITTYLIMGRVEGQAPAVAQQPALPLPQASGDPADRIRLATIGTLRQTLLAGETCNASSTNAYALALSHHDLHPVSLEYRDASMAKLHAVQPIRGLALELAAATLLIYTIASGSRLLKLELDGSSSAALMKLTPMLMASVLLLTLGLLLSLLSLWRSKANEENGSLFVTVAPQQPSDSHLDSLAPRQVIRGEQYRRPRSGLRKTLTELIGSAQGRLSEPFGERVRCRLGKLAGLLMMILTGSVEMTASVQLLLAHHHGAGSCQPDKLALEQLSSASEHASAILSLVLLNSSSGLLCQRNKLSLMLLLGWSHLLGQVLSSRLAARAPSCRHAARLNWWLGEASLIGLALVSLLLGRLIEYTRRTNFLWRNRLNVDHEELEYISGINKVLLENILPSHVVQHYLTNPEQYSQPPPTHRQPESQPDGPQGKPGILAHRASHSLCRMNLSNMNTLKENLYHEQHDSVAVMFASIPHFYEFYDESDISKQGLGCIALLNEIICDFDKLLLKNKFSRIEKIKTIGSTYMAAAGLRPSNLVGPRNSTASQISVGSSTIQTGSPIHNPPSNLTSNSRLVQSNNGGMLFACDVDRRSAMSQQKLNLICMIKFATSLMGALNGINKQSFQVFKLRIGVNSGSVIAGVIGAQRPFYDIWGDCVNIASRMESLGEVGRIQVEERTAKLLMESLSSESYSLVRRGPIDVKGKGGMVTYFVDRRPASQSLATGRKVSGEGHEPGDQQPALQLQRNPKG